MEEFGDLDRSKLMGKYAYGNKNASEFCAEAFAEYYCLENPPTCIFRKNRALAPHERSAVPLGTDHCPVG